MGEGFCVCVCVCEGFFFFKELVLLVIKNEQNKKLLSLNIYR